MVRAVVCRVLGPPAALSLEQRPPAALAPGQVRVALHACGVNFPDILMAAGKYQHKPPLPFVPGFEAAGEIVEIAPDVTGFKAGERVIARMRQGGYADEAVIDVRELLPMPAAFSFAEAAGFVVGYHTAYHALVQRGRVGPGQVLLVHGAAGGVGLAAVELGKLLGATVIATGSSDAKLAIVRQRGADHVINYSRGPFRDQVKELTAGAGADVIYDPVGGEVFDESLRCIAWGGRLLLIGFAGGRIPVLPANLALLKGCAIVGVRAGEHGRRDAATGRSNMEVLLRLAGEGKLRPHISHQLPLERFAEAMQVLLDRQAVGRVVLTTGR